jgi:uncharacterized cupredoxin-like copper-binding protein
MKYAAHIVTSALLITIGSAVADENHTHVAPKKFSAARVEATAFGQQGDPAKINRTIRVSMSDGMRFEPASVKVRNGETVRFVVVNEGALLHEMVLGTVQTLKEHRETMKKHPGMSHDEPGAAHVKPGATGEIVWRFTQPGEFQFACLLPGHFEAGMVGKVIVT